MVSYAILQMGIIRQKLQLKYPFFPMPFFNKYTFFSLFKSEYSAYKSFLFRIHTNYTEKFLNIIQNRIYFTSKEKNQILKEEYKIIRDKKQIKLKNIE